MSLLCSHEMIMQVVLRVCKNSPRQFGCLYIQWEFPFIKHLAMGLGLFACQYESDLTVTAEFSHDILLLPLHWQLPLWDRLALVQTSSNFWHSIPCRKQYSMPLANSYVACCWLYPGYHRNHLSHVLGLQCYACFLCAILYQFSHSTEWVMTFQCSLVWMYLLC